MDNRYLAEQYTKMHNNGLFTGESLRRHLPEIQALIRQHNIKTVLDYGCGKGAVHKDVKLADSVTLYDPYYEPYSQKPNDKYGMVICTDVLEHIPEEGVQDILRTLIDYTGKVLFLSVCTRAAKKTFENGENVHVTIKSLDWWKSEITIAYVMSGRDIDIVIREHQ
jgi:2-polyprenyl-3-methyl-5-hydroxy-6-metoxy-1,4-benzoquinol methylase